MISSNLVDDFLDYMKSTKGSSDNTVKEYYYDLRVFVRFIKRRKNLVNDSIDFNDIPIEDISPEVLESVTKQDIYAYNAFLERERKISNRSKFRKISSVRSFYNYLYAKIEVIKKNPIIDIDMPKVEKTLPVYLTLDQSLELLKTIEKAKMKPVYKKRDYAIVTLFLNCGMRLSELSSINIDHIKTNTLRVIGKGNKERTVYLNDMCLDALDNYLKIRPEIDNDALFISKKRNRMSNRAIQYRIEHYLKVGGFDTSIYSVHKLRHTAATLMYQYGDVDIKVLQEILGHESVSTTQIYTHVDNNSLRNAVNKNPLNSLNNDLKNNK